MSFEEAAKWTLQITGSVSFSQTLSAAAANCPSLRLVKKTTTLSLFDLQSGLGGACPTVTLPVTLVCAGNRRKEQNVVRKSLGFNWGAAGLSTALFTGVYLCDVLDYVGIQRGAKHVIFEGADKLPNGPYGTSQKIQWARDKVKGMMLAWGMNGLPLECVPFGPSTDLR